MNILKKAGIILGIIIGLPLVVAIFVSGDLNYEKSITINRPIDEVWPNVSSLAAMDKWSPWNDLDPNMKKSLTGADGQVGAMASWDSDEEKVGKGSQTISNIVKPTLFETDLKFYSPYENEAKGYVKLEQEGDATVVTWGFSSEMPYPARIMLLFMNMEEQMDAEWNKGLGKLKAICEG
jgi:Polyketide cyclase / dehydrase and lipid transport